MLGLTRVDGTAAAPLQLVTRQSLVVRDAGDAKVEWIIKAQQVAKSGYPQLCLLVMVLIWTLVSRSRWQNGRAKTAKIPLVPELCSLLARTTALGLMIVGAVETGDQWMNVAVIASAFAIGLLRLAKAPQWRRLAVLQTNVVLAAAIAIVFAAEVLPQLRILSTYEANPFVLGALLSMGIAVLIALLTPRVWVHPPAEKVHVRAPPAEPSPEETCSLFDYYLTFEWLTPLIWKGSRRPIEMDDLPSLPWYDEPLKLLRSIMAIRAEKKQKTIWTVFKFQRTELITMAIFVGLTFAIELVAPFAMYHLLAYIDRPSEAVLRPVIWLFLLFAGPMARTVCFQQYVFTSTRLIVRVKSAMTQELYQRAMSSMELEEDVLNAIESKGGKKEGVQSTSIGRLSNLMASDIDAITSSRDIMQVLIGMPIGVVLSLAGLYLLLGWPSLVGTAFMLVMSPAPAMVARLMGVAQRKVKMQQDSRISLITEYLSSIKAIKYFAWEASMIKKIDDSRAQEQRYQWHITLFTTLMHCVTEFIPIIALVLIFSLYVGVLKQPLTAETAFTTLSLVLTMRNHLGMVGYMSRNAINGWISKDRLDRYFASTTPLTQHPEGPPRVKGASFRRHKRAAFTLQDLSVDFVEGGLNVVTGPSGSGKTTLLLSLMGETLLEGGSVTAPRDIAYASQTPWLQSETIRDNILFGSDFEQVRYDRVLAACCLGVDLDELPARDETEVGESGTSLSGGQRARVALARALYSKAPLLLLDDTFSALDAKTASDVWNLCFCSDLLHGRTVILVTQMPWVSAMADLAITIDSGRVKSAESNIGVVRKPVMLEHQETVEAIMDDAAAPSGGLAAKSADPKSASPKGKVDDIADEMQNSGRAARLGFFRYMLYFGGPLYAGFAIFTSILANACLLATTYWLSLWVDSAAGGKAVDITFYLSIYVAIVLGGVLVDCLSFLVYCNGAWVAAKTLHERCVRSVMYVSLSWWKRVPVGRVVNRFSRDMSSLDSDLPRMLQAFLELFFMLFARMGAISSIMPIFMLPGLATCLVGIIAGELYTRTVVIVRRLVSSSRSPVFSQFSDSLAGMAVIRARHGMAARFGDRLADRLRSFSRASEANYNCNRWVAMRIDFVTALVSLAAAIIAVSKSGTVAAGLVGFSLTNATGLSETILYMVRFMNELEVEIQSFERVIEYANVEPEEKTDGNKKDEELAKPDEFVLDKSWPRSGAVELRNVTIRYGPDGPDILKDINLKFDAGQRVAIVGRTGSGKSTMVLSLLNLTTIVKGQILYDGIDITAIPRERLRQGLTIIPQEATLFNGTVGSNLDPSGEIPTPRLAKALEACGNIASFSSHAQPGESNGLTNKDSKGPDENTPLLSDSHGPPETTVVGLSLDTVVQARGDNFSHGQRQVLSLCRALVRRSKLMLLDEATASMDYETDRGIQEVLRAELDADHHETRGRTLVTIAHRLRTIADYDKVVVLAAGQVIEHGSPADLYTQKGHFYDMVRHSGEADHIEHMLKLTDSSSSSSVA